MDLDCRVDGMAALKGYIKHINKAVFLNDSINSSTHLLQAQEAFYFRQARRILCLMGAKPQPYIIRKPALIIG